MTDRRRQGPTLAVGGTPLGDLAVTAVLAAGLAATAAWAAGVPSARSDLAAAVLVLPLAGALSGYAALAAVTPRGRQAPRPFVAVPAASLAVSALTALALALAPVAATVASFGGALATLTFGLSAVAGGRRLAGATGPPVDWPAAVPRGGDGDRTPVAFLAVTAVVLVACLAYVGVAAPPPETFTSLSVAPTGDATLDSLELTPGEETSVAVAVENQEGERARYTVVARVEVVRTTGEEPTILGRQSSDRFETTLAPGERWERTHTVSPPPVPGRQRLVFYLYRGDAPADPGEASAYRSTVVWEPTTSAE